jgi:hypothetical protein
MFWKTGLIYVSILSIHMENCKLFQAEFGDSKMFDKHGRYGKSRVIVVVEVFQLTPIVVHM